MSGHIHKGRGASGRIGLISALMLCLSACGGGGSSSSAGGSTTTTPSQDPPALPIAEYEGPTTPAVLPANQAGVIAAFIFSSIQENISISRDIVQNFPGGTGTVSGSIPGPNGGEVVFNGYISGFNLGWVTETFTNYGYTPTGSNAHFVANGVVLLEVTGSQATLGFSGYRARGPGFDVSFSGSATQSSHDAVPAQNIPQTLTTTLNLGVLDNLSNEDEKFVDFTVTTLGTPSSSPGYGYLERTLSGRVYDSRVGYVDASTTGPLLYPADPSAPLPFSGADLLIKSTASNTLTVGPLNTSFFSVGVGSGLGNTIVSSARFNWSGFTLDTTPSTDGVSPIAVAEETNFPGTGIPVTLDGRFSHSPSGAFLTFNWTLLHSPPGSSAVLSDSSSPYITLTPDVVGDYLVKLTVSDGVRTASDEVVVSAPAQYGATEVSPIEGMKAGPDQTASVGQTVLLDARSSQNVFYDNLNSGFHWTLVVPPGSTATLSDANSPQPSFVPDVPGYYHVELDTQNIFSLGANGAFANITVGEPITFDPPMLLDANLNQYDSSSYGIADLDGDGRPDLVVYGTLSGGAAAAQIYTQIGGGQFKTGVPLGGSGGQTSFAIGDLNGDGRPDVVGLGSDPANTAGTLSTYLQGADGSFAAPITTEYAQLWNANAVSLGKLGNPGVLTVVTTGASGRLDEIPVDPSGSLGADSYTPLSGAIGSALTITDYNNDGYPDILASANAFTANTDGTFTAYSATGNTSTAVTDLYGDGKNELVLGVGSSVTIEPESGGGSAVTLNSLQSPLAIGSGDFDGDGRADIIALHETDPDNILLSQIGIFYQQPDTSFGAENLFQVEGQARGPLWVGDLNGDGIPDLVYVLEDEVVIQFGRRP